MNRVLRICLTATYLSAAQAMPIGCKEDFHCLTGYYCEVSQLYCQKCLRCEDLKRAPPEMVKAATQCIISVSECGSCFPGLVVDSKSNECMAPGASGQLLLPYEWAVVGVALLLALLVCAAAVFILRNFNTIKIRASTSTSLHSPVDNSMMAPTAPQPPPPYNSIMPPMENSEELRPFIKPILRPPGEEESLELAVNQTARVFNNPEYVRTLQPDSCEDPGYNDILSTIQEDSNSSNNQSNGNFVVSEAEGNDSVVQTSSAKIHCAQTGQDSNNNSDDDNTSSAAPMFVSNGTAIVINVMKNVNTVQQRNEMNL